MLHYTDTTVFNANAQTIVNTVNCVGVMGAGLALEFQLRFPEMEKDYVERCKRKEVKLGKPYLYKNYQTNWILNFPTKSHWKYPSKIEWIEEGLKYFVSNYQRGGITSVAFPKLGCSNGGLAWHDVSPLMEKYLKNLDIDVFICLDREERATGVEGKMVDLINSIESIGWDKKLGVRSDIKKKIISSLPIKKFRELGKIEGVGKQTYNDIFRFLYEFVGNLDVEKNKLESNDSLQLQFNESLPIEDDQLQNSTEQLAFKADVLSPGNETNGINFSQNGDYNAFFIILPYLEKALNEERTKDEIAEIFKLPKKLVGDWLEDAERLGKIKKLTRPVRYIAVSSQSYQQLECQLTT